MCALTYFKKHNAQLQINSIGRSTSMSSIHEWSNYNYDRSGERASRRTLLLIERFNSRNTKAFRKILLQWHKRQCWAWGCWGRAAVFAGAPSCPESSHIPAYDALKCAHSIAVKVHTIQTLVQYILHTIYTSTSALYVPVYMHTDTSINALTSPITSMRLLTSTTRAWLQGTKLSVTCMQW